MSVKKPNRSIIVAVILAIICVFAIGDLAVRRAQAVSDDTYKELATFANVLAIVKKNYVEPVTTKQLINGAISGMLASLDPHSAYLTPDLYRDLEVETRGSFGGLGLEITIKNDVLTVVSPIEGTPAYRAGLKANDEIVKINDDFTKGMTLTEAVKRMRGPKGSKIRLMIHREGIPDLFTVIITRDVIRIKSVKTKRLKGGYDYIRIVSFQDDTSDALRKALDDFNKEGHNRIKGLVLDLRDDPGGLLNQAVKTADQFLDGGLIVYTQGRITSSDQKYFAHKKKHFEDYPMVVLVNGGTASASEIVAGAVQDHRRGIIEGTTTFGKGSVQTILPLDDHSALRLTTARYFTPNGRSIQAVGITPDVDVEPPKPTLASIEIPGTTIDKNEEIRESDLLHHFKNGQRSPDNGERHPAKGRGQKGDRTSVPEKSGKRSAKAARPQKDIQLERAISILEHWNTYKLQLAKNESPSGDR